MTQPAAFQGGKSSREIVVLWHERRAAKGAIAERMRTMAAHYDADVAVPLPEIDRREDTFVANFFAQGIDQHGMRVASVMPNVTFPVIRPGVGKSEALSRTRRKAVYGWWQANAMGQVQRKRARHLIAYASSPVLIRPDLKTRGPRWEVRAPIETYPGETVTVGDMTPPDCVFTYRRTAGWLTRKYPGVMEAVNTQRADRDRVKDTDWVDVVEYNDEQQRTLVAVGEGHAATFAEAEYGLNGASIINLGLGGRQHWIAQLESFPNRAEMCMVVVPERIGLNNAKGQFDDSVGIYAMMAKLMSLDVNAVTRAVYPDTWFIHGPNGTGKITRVADGLNGVVGEVEGGDIKDMQLNPGYKTEGTIDRLERNIRLNTAQPAELGGESGSNIRTDRRGQSILSAAIDFYVQEHQEILARSHEAEIHVAAAVERGYFGSQRKSYYVTWPKQRGPVDYTPDQTWAKDIPCPVVVEYGAVGMDANGLMVFTGQEIGTGLLSKHTGRIQMPNINDPEFEERQVQAEGIEAALLSSIQTQASQGAITPPDLAAMLKLLKQGTEEGLAEVVIKVHEQAQARQASSGPPGTDTAPVEPGSPEAQPGLAQPGQGQEQPVEPIAAPDQSLGNLRNLLGDLSRSKQVAKAG